MAPILKTIALAVTFGIVAIPGLARAATHAAGVQPVIFTAPAGDAPAGGIAGSDAFSAILASGRIVHPAGTSVTVGTDAAGFALTPNGRFAIVSARGDAGTNAASSLAVVDVASMSIVSRTTSLSGAFFSGLVALTDPTNATRTLVLASGGPANAVYAFDVGPAGSIVPDAHATIAVPTPADARFANAGRAFPATIVLSADATRAFVIDTLGNDVAQIDTATRTLAGNPVAVGFFPYGAAVSAQGLLVANEGLGAYGILAAPAAAPAFANVAPDLARASSLAVLSLGIGNALGSANDETSVPLDRTPDGVRAVGGAHPVAIVASKTRPYAFVALSNVDRVATVALAPTPAAVGGTELRLYDRGPYGTQPSALALSADEKRLYVALSGIDAVAVLDTSDPLHPHRVGLIPTGAFPNALALSTDERFLYVTNATGNGGASTFEAIDLRGTDLRRSTPAALAGLRKIGQPKSGNPIVPQRFLSRGSTVIKHVVLILEEDKTYDAMLGDLTDAAGAPYGPGDPRDVAFGASVTPNLHALARTFGLAGNLYADAAESSAGHEFALGGIATAFTERASLGGRAPGASGDEDPEDYPRAGYLWNSLADRAKTYRDYGDLLRLAGYVPSVPAAGDASAALGLGGTYSLDVPAPAVLAGHVDLAYPGWSPRVRDVRRAEEFVRDFDPLVKTNAVPAFTEIWLPGNASDVPEDVADGDRALGTIVDYLTHTPQWGRTAIVIMPAAAASTRDHVDPRRTYAVVVSPYAKRHYLGMRHLSTVSVLKTEEELLGLPALSLGDELATDMSDFFARKPDRTPYERVDVPVQATGTTQ